MKMKVQYILLICMLFCAGCSEGIDKNNNITSEQQIQKNISSATRDFFAMDTYMQITAYGDQAEEAVCRAQTRVEELDHMLSTGMDDSEVSMLNRNKEGTLSEEAFYLMKRSLDIWEMTQGAFDPAIYPLMEIWGFSTGEYQVPDNEEINRQLANTNPENIKLYEDTRKVEFVQKGLKIDFGGIAKGYTSSQIMEIFREYNIESGIVSLGGNVQVFGHKTDGSLWRIAIQNPKSEEDYLGVLEAENKAVITSGGYERYFEQNGKTYHHILDTATGYPVENGLKSVTIVSEDGVLADALSTALFVMGLEQARKFWMQDAENFDIILLTEDEKIYVSEGIANSFITDFHMEVIRKDEE